MLFGAGMMLSPLEGVLKPAASKWFDFARESSDCQNVAEPALMGAGFMSERPLFFPRSWNSILALQDMLRRLGTALSVGAFE